jgi:tRNA A58 N-methylase Trm61
MTFSQFDRQVPRATNSFDARVAKAKLGLPATDLDAEFENLSAEQIKKLVERAARSDKQNADSARSQEAGNVFVELHPEFVDTQKNAKQVRAHCTAMGIAYPTLDDLERAYEALKSVGLVDLNQKELIAQQQRATKEAANGVRENQFDEADAYTLPLEEVRRRANLGW